MQLEADMNESGFRFVAARTDGLVAQDAFDEALLRVSAFRRRKALAFRFQRDRRLSLLAGLLLDELLGDYGLRECDMTYDEGPEGKPALHGFEELHFSLAHSREMAVAALAATPVGTDVEHLPSFAYDVAEPYDWTRMESVGKLLGSGVGGYVDGAEFHVPENVSVEHVRLGEYLACVAREIER